MTFYARTSRSLLRESERFKTFADFLRYHLRRGGRAELDPPVPPRKRRAPPPRLSTPEPPDTGFGGRVDVWVLDSPSEVNRQVQSFGGVPRGVYGVMDYKTKGTRLFVPYDIWQAAGLQDPPPRALAPWQESHAALSESAGSDRSPEGWLRHCLRTASAVRKDMQFFQVHMAFEGLAPDALVAAARRAGFREIPSPVPYVWILISPDLEPDPNEWRRMSVSTLDSHRGSMLRVSLGVWDYYGLPQPTQVIPWRDPRDIG